VSPPHDVGVIYGEVPPVGLGVAGAVGTIQARRPASDVNVKLAERLWPRARAEDFVVRDGLWIDRASGLLYRPALADPILSDNRAGISAFLVAGEHLVFLEATGGTVEEVEAAEREAVERAAEAERTAREYRRKQPQTSLRLSDLHPDRFPTLAEAARRIAEVDGQVRRGRLGELEVTVPARISPPGDGVMDGTLERETRQRAALAAETLVAGERVVLAALDELEADRGKSPAPLHERLPDVIPTLGGGA
jgi:hypothetical protein